MFKPIKKSVGSSINTLRNNKKKKLKQNKQKKNSEGKLTSQSKMLKKMYYMIS